jgi:hypothetical protein
VTHASAAGENQFIFNGRLGKRPLGPGSTA